MAGATVTLSTTTLSAPLSSSSRLLKPASTSGILPGKRLWLAEGKELVRVVALVAGDQVEVLRGVDGTVASPHVSGSTVYIGEAHEFYSQDPVGRPSETIPVSPYINVRNGSIWFAQGDALPVGQGERWWQRQETEYSVGALGVRQKTLSPTSST